MPLNDLQSTAGTPMGVFETSEFNNVNVLKFLLSKETTLAGLLKMAGRRDESSRGALPNDITDKRGGALSKDSLRR